MLKNNNLKYLIAGPCSAETQKQVLDTAKELTTIKSLSYFRAGIWKPRTNPNSFEGVGKKGLKWLQEVTAQFNLKTITEVATPKHVEICLKHNIDALWIGARTTVNPFYIEEIAEALKGVNIPVFIKNPISPDFGLWAGAIERFKNKGLTNLVAVHRGFYTYQKSEYRNQPNWEIPVKLMFEFPNLDVICDPSHITGNSKLIEETANLALRYKMSGLMIETHINPLNSWSDSEQQITPAHLKKIISRLNFNFTVPIENEMKELRTKIDKQDTIILNEIAKRLEIVKEIASLKQQKSIAYFQLDRWKNVINNVILQSKKLNLNATFVTEIMNLIHKEALNIHQKIDKKAYKDD